MDHARGMPIKIHSHKAGKFLLGFIKAITLRIVTNYHSGSTPISRTV